MTWRGTVDGVNPGGSWTVMLAGSGPVVAWNTTGLALAVGDTVVLEQRDVGVWEVVQRVTGHPAPLVTAKPTVSVTGPPTTSFSGTTIPGFANPPGSGSTVNQVIDWLWNELYPWMGATKTATQALQGFGDDARSNLNTLRTATTTLATGVGDAFDYTAGSVDAAVQAGSAVKVQGFTVPSVRAGHVAGYEAWGHDVSADVEAWLTHRVTWPNTIRTVLQAARTFRGLSAAPTLGASPAVDTTDASWSAAVVKIQAVDTWAASARTSLASSIDSLRSNLTMPVFSYPVVVVTWSDLGTFEASRNGLAASLSAFNVTYTTGLAAALIEAVRKINAQ